MLIGFLCGVLAMQTFILITSMIFRSEFDMPTPIFLTSICFFAIPTVIIMIPLYLLWRLFRHCFYPVDPERFFKVFADSKHKSNYYKITKRFYFCTDWDSSKFFNKIYFVRLKKAD